MCCARRFVDIIGGELKYRREPEFKLEVAAFLTALDEAKGLTAFNGFEFGIPFIHKQFAVCTPPVYHVDF